MTHDSAELEKGHSTGLDKPESYIYGENTVVGAKTVAEATGRGGETHRGLKSRHIQFM